MTHSAPVGCPAWQTGTPRLAVIVKDSVGNQYRATIPVQELQVYGS
jgi:hypothetical protein